LNPKDLLVIIPHSGLYIPPEIDQRNIDKNVHRELLIPVDVDTDKLYDFPEIPKFIFKYLRSIIDVNQSPDDLDDSCPVKTIYNNDIYLDKPGIEERKYYIKHYHQPFHEEIINYLNSNKPLLIVDSHSTHNNDVDEHGDRFTGEITISNYQATEYDKDGYTKTCAGDLLKYFEDCLKSHGINVKANTKYLTRTYGYIEEFYSKKYGIPLITIECNESLYKNNIDGINKILYSSIEKTVDWTEK